MDEPVGNIPAEDADYVSNLVLLLRQFDLWEFAANCRPRPWATMLKKLLCYASDSPFAKAYFAPMILVFPFCSNYLGYEVGFYKAACSLHQLALPSVICSWLTIKLRYCCGDRLRAHCPLPESTVSIPGQIILEALPSLFCKKTDCLLNSVCTTCSLPAAIHCRFSRDPLEIVIK